MMDCKGQMFHLMLCLWMLCGLVPVTGSVKTLRHQGAVYNKNRNLFERNSGTEFEDKRSLTSGNNPDTQFRKSAIVQNLTLELSNTSPAVLDSAVIFRAKLRDFTGQLVDSSKFEYNWHDREKSDMKVTWDEFSSSITRVYRGDQYQAGTYSMTVIVKKDRKVVDVKTMDYVLTGRLNGNMTVHQNLTYQRQHDVLSTDKPMMFKAQVYDKFRKPSPEVLYHWFMDKQPIGTFDKPELNLSLGKAGPKHVAVVVTAKLMSDVFVLPRYVNKSGYFSQYFTLKDPLNRMIIQGGEAVPINKLFYMNVSCHGSGPTSLCWQVSPISGGGSNQTCSPTLFQQRCQHLVNLTIPTPGKYMFRALLINDVSRLERQWYLYVYDPGSVNVPAITVPVVFGFLAVLIIVVGAAYIAKLRKKPYVEVADFDFHPSLTREVENSKISVKIRRTVQTLISSPGAKGTSRPVKSTYKIYGSVEDENNGL